MPVCPVFAVGLDGKCGTGEQRLQGGPDRDRLSAAALPVEQDHSSGGYPVFLPTDGKARGLDALDVFETCVEVAARYFAKRP
jgi:hypothetical protein